jgi:hypothetical protein
MKLHTNLTGNEVRTALQRAQGKSLITPDIHFTVFTPGRSLTHPHGYEIQLGTHDQHSLPAGYTDQHGQRLRVRRARNSSHGEDKWAATWHEWGWLIMEVFAADPGARWGADPARCARPEYAWGYSSQADFHRKTDSAFLPPLPDPGDSGRTFTEDDQGRWHPVAYHSGGNPVIPVPGQG